METETLEQTCRRLEHFETPQWAVDAIFRRETITDAVIDPCCGTGVLAEAARPYASNIVAIDVHDYGYKPGGDEVSFAVQDWFRCRDLPADTTCILNPPFSRAVEFVEHAFELGTRKIICFQRFAWWESQKRAEFWAKRPPNRVYVCGDRADCWRHDIPKDERGSGTTTAHAWYVWERGHPPGTLLGHIRRTDANA